MTSAQGWRGPRLFPVYLLAFICTGALSSQADLSGLIFPAKPEWKFAETIGGRPVEFALPAERYKIFALDKKMRDPILDHVKRIERNQALIRKVGMSFFGPSRPPEKVSRLTPDYQRSLGEVAISISRVDADSENPLVRNLPILKALPTYSKIHIVMPPSAITAAKIVLAAENLLDRSFFHDVSAWAKSKDHQTSFTRSTRWIRDSFLVGNTPDQRAVVFKPLAYAFTSDLQNSDLNFLEARWHKQDLVVSIPGFVRGGNVMVADNVGGHRMAFLGRSEIEQNQALFVHSAGLASPRDLVPEMIKQLAGVDHVTLISNSENLFHIDMAVSFIGAGVAAVLSPIDESRLNSEDLQVIADLRKSLAKRGFQVINIPTTEARIRAFQSPVNILPWTDKTTGKRRALVPLFPDAQVSLNGRATSLNEAIQKAYETAGVEMTWVEDRFSELHGNLHCTILGLY